MASHWRKFSLAKPVIHFAGFNECGAPKVHAVTGPNQKSIAGIVRAVGTLAGHS